MSTPPTVQDQGFVQKSLAKLGIGTFQYRKVNEFNNQMMDQAFPWHTEVTRSGKRFRAGLSTLTGRAPVQAIPTTTATVYLYNGDSALAYVVDYLNIVCASGTPGAGCGLLALMSKPTSTLPTAGANYGIANCSPNSNNKSNAIIGEAYTIPTVDTTGVASWAKWITIAATNPPASAYQGGGDASDAYQEGRFIIPPGWGLAMAFLSAAGTTPLFGIMASWSEINLSLE